MNLDIDPTLWRSLVAVADHGGFTRAARRLNRTQSAVSMQIRRLEDAAGVALFERGGAEVRLTRAGKRRLQPLRRATLVLRIRITSADGQASTITRKLQLKR